MLPVHGFTFAWYVLYGISCELFLMKHIKTCITFPNVDAFKIKGF